MERIRYNLGTSKGIKHLIEKDYSGDFVILENLNNMGIVYAVKGRYSSENEALTAFEAIKD